MIRNLSETVVLPIAGIILTFVLCYELIQLIIEKNNLSDFDTFNLFKWIFKSFIAVFILTNTFNIVMGIFALAQTVVSAAHGLIVDDVLLGSPAMMEALEAQLEVMGIGELLGIWLQMNIIGLATRRPCSTRWTHRTTGQHESRSGYFPLCYERDF